MEINPPLPVRIWGLDFNYATIFMSLVVSFILILVFYLATRQLKMVPGRLQALVEIIAEFFDNILTQTFGKERGRRYLSIIGTLFLFICLSNMIGLLPIPQFRILGFPIPEFVEPTRDYNTPFALMVFVLFLVHGSEIRTKGLWGYIKTYFKPYFIAPYMFPMNILGRIGHLLSLHFRLFGNIFGGAVIIMLVNQGWAVIFPPVPLIVNVFFGLFVGLIQAFVFTILVISYTAVAIAEE